MGDENTDNNDAGSADTLLTADTGAADQNTDTGAADANSDAGNSADGAADTGNADGGDTGSEGSQTPPDTYADFTMPEGSELDEAVLSDATPIFKELGLTQDNAQKLIDLYAKQVQAGSQKQIDTFNQLMSDWGDQSKNDNEFGGDKFDESVKIAQNAVAKYGTPELKQLLEEHGVGNHPEVIRFMVRVGHTLKEDVPGSSGTASSQAADRVSILYPKTNDS